MNLEKQNRFVVLVILIAAFSAVNSEEVKRSPKWDVICEDVTLGIFPNPNECTSYIICVFGTANPNSCPSMTPIFDADSSLCVPGNPDTCEIFVPT